MYTISWPNRITLMRILLVGPFALALLHLQNPEWDEHARWAALVMFAVMAVSDGIDGYLARRLHEETAIGRFLDPLADKILILCSVTILAHEGTHVTGTLLPAFVAVIVVGKELIIVVGFCIIYFETSYAYIDPKRVGKWCTTFQLLMVIAILLSPDLPGVLSYVPDVLWWIASALAVMTVVTYFRLGHKFVVEFEANKKVNS